MNRRLLEHPDPSSDATSHYDQEYRHELFRLAAEHVRAEITDRTWLAFQLTAIDERPIAVVASELNMSVGSVYIARSRVMARLREMVTQFE
jgi:RNA polymerase sigma-70 factor (ECF subfamily)